MPDRFDRERYAAAYRLLAEVLGRDRPDGKEEDHLSYILGNLTRRLFVGSHFQPPDEIFEQVALVLRQGDLDQARQMAEKLREHAAHLEALNSESG